MHNDARLPEIHDFRCCLKSVLQGLFDLTGVQVITKRKHARLLRASVAILAGLGIEDKNAGRYCPCGVVMVTRDNDGYEALDGPGAANSTEQN